MGELRRPFFIAALVLWGVVVLVEVGAPILLPRGDADPVALQAALDRERPEDSDMSVRDLLRARKENPPTPGLAIPYLALLDALVLLTLGLIGLSLLLPERAHGRIQGVITLVVSFLDLVGSFLLIWVAFALLMVMVALFTSVPFGTLAYLAIWGFFDRGPAAATLSLLMLLKLGSAICLVVAQPRFLQNKGLVLLVLFSVLANVIVAFLHGLVPIILVSITDALAAIVIAVLALVWSIVLLIGAIVGVVKALKPGRRKRKREESR